MARNIEDLDILWLGYDGVHPAHRNFADSIGAEVVNLTIDSDPGWSNAWRYVENGIKQGHYDYVICNEGPSLRSGAPMKFYSWLKPGESNTKVIRYLANANYYFITQGDGARPYFNRFVANFVDGGIANSKFTEKNGKKFIDGPIRTAIPPIRQELYDKLPKNGHNCGSRKILSVGNNSWYKGKDLLVEAFQIVKEDYPEAELILVGSETKEWSDKDNVKALGRVKDVAPYYDKADVYVQSSRGDGFGVVVPEAMRSGIPTVVTETTGASEIVRDLDDNLIRDVDPKDIAQGIKYYFELSEKRKKQLSETARDLSEPFSPENRKSQFREESEELVEELEK
ncbi:MAG: hypothetical protein BRC29_00780 [Nanohaloarchaea archaeon SW_7_43_1]|nr:MAG: hypothetical protein BRC29_00780 [Nanohaloarchaea archaeon SW_7_43_1]